MFFSNIYEINENVIKRDIASQIPWLKELGNKREHYGGEIFLREIGETYLLKIKRTKEKFIEFKIMPKKAKIQNTKGENEAFIIETLIFLFCKI